MKTIIEHKHSINFEIPEKTYNRGDFYILEIPFKYFFLRSYYPTCERWGDIIHIALAEEYKFKGEPVGLSRPICGILEQNDLMEKTALKPWTPGKKRNKSICKNCLHKLLLENDFYTNFI